MTTARRRPGLPWRVLSAWGGLRASVRSLAGDGTTEARLLVIAMLSGLIRFLETAMLTRLGVAGQGVAPEDLSAFYAAQFVSSLLFRTMMLYGVAALFGLILRRTGGQGSWIETRAAVFWAFLVTAPIQLALALSSALFGMEHAEIALPVGAQLGGLLLAAVLSIFLAEMHRVKPWPIFLGILIVSLAGVLLTGLTPRMV